MANKKQTQNESANVIKLQGSEYTVKDNNGKDVKFESVIPAAISENEESGDALPRVTFSTYTTKKGATAPQIIGFGGESDPRWQSHNEAGHKYCKAGWKKDLSGNKVYILMFGTKYMDVARALCNAYNGGDADAIARAEAACQAVYEQAQRDGKARWEEQKAQWAAQREAQKNEERRVKSEEPNGQSSMVNGQCPSEPFYSAKDVAEMLQAILAGGDIPAEVERYMKAAA